METTWSQLTIAYMYFSHYKPTCTQVLCIIRSPYMGIKRRCLVNSNHLVYILFPFVLCQNEYFPKQWTISTIVMKHTHMHVCNLRRYDVGRTIIKRDNRNHATGVVVTSPLVLTCIMKQPCHSRAVKELLCLGEHAPKACGSQFVCQSFCQSFCMSVTIFSQRSL